ncbi:MAG: hypothetical protein ACRC8S_00020 [Fimbriiglobus sp.]
MIFLTKKFLFVVPAAVVVLGALCVGVMSLSASTSVSELPTKTDSRLMASEITQPTATSRDWQEVSGTRTRKGWR